MNRAAAGLLLCAVMALHGCGKKDRGDEIVYQCAANTAEVAALEADIPGFAAQSGITIRLNPFSGDEKLLAMIAAGQEPDIFYASTALRDRLAAEGHLLDLRTIAEGDPFVARLYDAALEDGRAIDGGWYSCGNWAFTCGVYYNRRLFDEARIPYPDTSWTWDDMQRAARVLTRDKNGDGKTDQHGIYIGTHFVETLERMNHAPIGRDEMLLSISPEAREVFEKYLALLDAGLMPDPRRVQAMGMQPPQMLENGTVAMLVEGLPNPSMYAALRVPWGVAPLPRFAGKAPLYFRSRSGGLCISARTKNPARTWAALKWIIGTASAYQPNPVLRDVDFTGGWEARYPALRGSGFREVWERSLVNDGGDSRYFARLSSWTMNPIMERFQPLLDRLWARDIGIDAVLAEIPSINTAVEADLARILRETALKPAFRRALEERMHELAPRKSSDHTTAS